VCFAGTAALFAEGSACHAASALSSRVAALQTATAATPCPSKPCTWQRTWNTFTLAFLYVCTLHAILDGTALTIQHRRPSSASFWW
jgi:hypothetical protein